MFYDRISGMNKNLLYTETYTGSNYQFTFHDNFLQSWLASEPKLSELKLFESGKKADTTTDRYHELILVKEGIIHYQEYQRAFFFQILGNVGSLVLTIMGIIRAFTNFHHMFTRNIAMKRSLYGWEQGSSQHAESVTTDQKVTAEQAKKALSSQVENRREFSGNYFSFLLYYILPKICCCLNCCISRSTKIKRQQQMFAKMQLASERLVMEHDIQYIILMNRITSLLHKVFLK